MVEMVDKKHLGVFAKHCAKPNKHPGKILLITKTLSENGAGFMLYDLTLQQHREREVWLLHVASIRLWIPSHSFLSIYKPDIRYNEPILGTDGTQTLFIGCSEENVVYNVVRP